MVLEKGITKFQRSVFPDHADLFNKLAKGQSPEVLFITCSDSRIDPHLITQTLPGDLFVLRNAGNLVPADCADFGSASAVEYAVAALKVKHIVVCGHSSCGAVTGLLNPESLTSLPVVAKWMESSTSVAESVASLPEGERLDSAIRENVRLQLKNLGTHPSVAKALENGSVKLHGWVYDIASGSINGVL